MSFEKDQEKWAERPLADLAYWYPLIKDHVPTPRTEIIKTDVDFWILADGKMPKGFNAFLEEYRAAIERIGPLPVFLRTGHTSVKHEWRDTCFLTDIDRLAYQVGRIALFSCVIDFMGLPLDTWVAREMLPTEPAFTAFDDLPICEERRYFVLDGKVLCHHSYWPMEAIEDHNPSVSNWKSHLGAMSQEGWTEVEDLTRMTEKVGQILGGFWSVDWLWTKDGWYLTDMAPGNSSWHWPECKNAK